MSGVVLGAVPIRLTVNFTAGADFVQHLVSTAGNWPGTAVIALAFNDDANTVWNATIVDDTATWNVDKAVVATLVNTLPTPVSRKAKVELICTDGTADLVWATGGVLLRGDW